MIALAAGVLALVVLASGTTYAGSATWSGMPESGDWNAAKNWVPMVVPNGPADTATFGSTSQSAISLSAAIELNGIVITPGASAYTITCGPTLILNISSAGVVNSSGATQKFQTNADSADHFGTVRFSNAASAGSQTLYTNGGALVNQAFSDTRSGGATEFNNSSSAGTATFVNQGGLVFLANGGATTFSNTANAGSADFVNDGGAGSGGRGGLTRFRDSASAGNATFTTLKGVDTNSGGGRIEFRDQSTAANGRFTNNGTVVSGGVVGTSSFLGTSTAGNAVFINNGGDIEQGSGGFMQFDEMSTAGNGMIINRGGTRSFAAGGLTRFIGNSTAGNSTIINNGSTLNYAYGGKTLIMFNAAAGNATLIAEGGSNGGTGGTIFIADQATAELAKMKIFGNGILDLHNRFPNLSVGSVEGTGIVFVGSTRFTVGSNNASTTFSGLIQEAPFTGGSLTKTGIGRLTLYGANAYTGTTIIEAGGLLIDNLAGSGTGLGAVTVNNNGSVLGGTGTISGPVTVNQAAILLGGDPGSASGSLKLANDVTLNSGAIIQLVLDTSGGHSSLSRTGGTWSFAPNQAFSFINLGAQPGSYDHILTGLAGDPGGLGAWTITTPGFAGTFSYDGAGNIDLSLSAAPSPPPTTLGNISTRLHVGTGDNVLIGGFIVTGTQPKRIIVRAIGPSLPLAGALTDPILELRDSSGGFIQANDNWRSDQETEIMATGVAPGNNLESAIVATLPAHGSAYTAMVRGVNDATGVGLVEAYDLDRSADSKLANISTRGLVQTDENVLIAGTIVLGQASRRVIVRAIGPSLSVPGKLEDPTLELRDGNGGLIRSNDNWRSDQEAEIIATGIPPANDAESAIVATLPANGAAYTAIVRGVNGTTGVAVVEVYALN